MTLRKMSDKRSRFATLLFLLAAVPAGIIVGVLYYGVSQIIPLILVDTFITAVIALSVLVILQRKAAVANPTLALVFAILFSLFIYASYQYVEYLSFRADAIRHLQTTNQASMATAAQELEARLVDRMGHGGFIGYLTLRAQTGTGLTTMISYQGIVAPVGSGFRLTGALVWLFWLIEFLLIAGLLVWIGTGSARRTFAAAGVSNMGNRIGNVSIEQADEFAQLLKAEAFDEAWQLVTLGGEAPHPTIEVYAHQKRKKITGNSLVLAACTSLDHNGQVCRKELYWTEVPNSKMPKMGNG